MELFYNKHIDSHTKEFILEKEENNHIIKVLRKKQGDIVEFTNGNNISFKTKIITIAKKSSTFKIISRKKINPPPHLHIGISILKSPSRFEVFLEKAVEIGVSEITPIICERTYKKTINLKRLNKILISALKQSFKYSLPKLNNPIDFKSFIKLKNEKNKLIATCEDYNKSHLSNEYNIKMKNLIMIGPEGDFSKKELDESKHSGFKFVSLSDTRLRAETAGIMACAIFSFIK